MKKTLDYIQEMLLAEYVVYKKGHKNSRGEEAPWVIVSHTSKKVISSHTSEEEAKKHLKDIQMFKHVRK